ncbi:MAG: class I SAM-dependent methyltransferase [Bacteroidetes bacterium]|nr:class I SAM-dependent methyltransferase [Bacteroidota bacterium]MCY4205970.1 class I SAM-dependent methyltransferase [Bacteroidota bacterium]
MKDPKAFNFDGDYGEDYKELASKVIPGYDELFVATLSLLQERLSKKAQLLIVGCGTGREIEVFAPSEHGWTFDCVDPSMAMIDYSRQLAERLEVSSRVRFHNTFTHELDLRYQFDAATVINVMHFLLDDGSKDALMQSVAQRVRSGGTVILFDLHGNISEPYFKLFYDAWMRYMDLRGYTGKKKERLRKRLESGIAYADSERILEICHSVDLRLIRPYWSGLLYTAWIFEKVES